MPKQSYNINLSYSAKKLFEIVSDIEKYPEFIPWVSAARIISKNEHFIIAELMVKYKIFRSRYTSKVHLTPYSEIKVELVKGPFEYLHNLWKFTENDKLTAIDFNLDFKINSTILENLISKDLEYYSKQLMNAFIDRANKFFC